MPATMQEVSLRDVVREVPREGDESTREIAERCIQAADEEQNHEALVRGWQQEVLAVQADWARPPVRSGHNNQSGRFRNLAALQRTVRTKDGSAYLLADVTRELCLQLKGEYAVREKAEGVGRKFWTDCEHEMRRANVGTLAELGEERVQALIEKHGYRV
jgi:hypothetical protein